MKKFISLLSVLTILMTAFLVVRADTVSIPENRPHFIGTFIQPWLYASWSDERADQEFTNMKDIGIEYIIMGDTVTKNSSQYDVTYPTTVEAAKKYFKGSDMVDMILRYCKKYGMKCYLGMGNDTDWSFIYAGHRDAFMNFCRFSASVATDLYTQYKTKYPDTFYGFYFTPELCNCSSFNNDADRSDCVSFLSDGFNLILDTINKLDPAMPLLYSPYVNVVAGNATFENTMAFYTEFYKKTNFREIDILCPQDSIGAGGQKLDQLDKWTKGYKDALAASGKKTKLWSNCEDFVQPKNVKDDWTSADVKRFIQQMQITSKYCEAIVTFAYPHYWSPINTDSGFNRAYIQYLKTGETDNVAPTTPLKVRFDKETVNNTFATIRWTPATDDYDIARYNLYQYDSSSVKFKEIGSNVILRRDGGDEVPALSTEFEVKYINQTAIFALEAMDCAGNLSQKVVFEVDLSKDNNGVDLSADGGASGITAVVDDLDHYAQDIHDGKTTTTANSTETTTSKTVTTETTAPSETSSIITSGTAATLSTESRQQDTTETAGGTPASGTTANPKTGSHVLTSLWILSAVALGFAVTLSRKKLAS